MNLESRARRAVASLKASMAGLAAPAGGAAPAPSRRRLVGGLAIGGGAGRRRARGGRAGAPLLRRPGDGGRRRPLPDHHHHHRLAADLDGTTTLPDHRRARSRPLRALPGPGRPPRPDLDPHHHRPRSDGQNGGNSPSPDEGGSEGDQADILPGFWASQAYGCSAEEEPVELFYGGGEPGETIALDSPYGSATVVVDEDGYWEASIAFAGAAYDEPFVVTAASSAGEAWELTFVVTDPANGECAPPVDYWFSAYQLSGCSIEEPPSDQFYGSGLPGDTITLDSPYGGGTAVVDESGWWEITLTFEGAPIGEIFTVTATSGDGEVWEMSFTAADPENGECVPPMEYWFSAYQGSGCSMEALPADYFYGTGVPRRRHRDHLALRLRQRRGGRVGLVGDEHHLRRRPPRRALRHRRDRPRRRDLDLLVHRRRPGDRFLLALHRLPGRRLLHRAAAVGLLLGHRHPGRRWWSSPRPTARPRPWSTSGASGRRP